VLKTDRKKWKDMDICYKQTTSFHHNTYSTILQKGKSIVAGQSDLTEKKCHRSLLAVGFLLDLLFYPEDGESMFLSKSVDFYHTTGSMSQTTELFIGSTCHLISVWLTL
jgi:hypothetical protein